jgi:hypothetical protein
MNAPFATALAGWKTSAKNKLAWPLVPNVADVDSAESMRIAAGVLDALGVVRNVTSDVPKDPGGPLEQAVCDHLRAELLQVDHPLGPGAEHQARVLAFTFLTLLP